MDKKEFQILIGKRIKQLREERKLSQVELANLCDFEKSNMNRLEAGKTNPTILTLNKICTALGVSLQEFFTFTQTEN